MQPQARVWYDEAMALYAARDYRAAVSALEAAYAIDPRREILFAQAQATRLAGDCPAALALYQRFLATQPPAAQVEATRIAVARCETLAAPARMAPAPAVSPAVVAPVSAPPRWYQDRAAGLLVGVGLVGAATGAVLMASAGAADEDAQTERARYDAYASRREKAERRWTWGLVSLIAGSALVAGGTGRYLWVAVHPRGGEVGAGARF
jgi:tetratricopeptide (TPR) repeat protein